MILDIICLLGVNLNSSAVNSELYLCVVSLTIW